MAVGPDQDLHPGPVGPDRADQATQVGGYFPTAGAAGRPQEGCNEPALVIEHDDGLEAVVIVMGIEQP